MTTIRPCGYCENEIPANVVITALTNTYYRSRCYNTYLCCEDCRTNFMLIKQCQYCSVADNNDLVIFRGKAYCHDYGYDGAFLDPDNKMSCLQRAMGCSDCGVVHENHVVNYVRGAYGQFYCRKCNIICSVCEGDIDVAMDDATGINICEKCVKFTNDNKSKISKLFDLGRDVIEELSQ